MLPHILGQVLEEKQFRRLHSLREVFTHAKAEEKEKVQTIEADVKMDSTLMVSVFPVPAGPAGEPPRCMLSAIVRVR